MKILHINPIDRDSKGVYQFHCLLRQENLDSQMLVQHKQSEDSKVFCMEKKREKCILFFQDTIAKIPLKFYKKRKNFPFSPAWTSFGQVLKKIQEIQPDIVHLHSFCGMLKIEELAKIQKPIVWSFHDMWPFTGGCHNALEFSIEKEIPEEICRKYEQNCGSCFILGSCKENDLSHQVWQRKKKIFSQLSNLTLIATSDTIKQNALESSLLKEREVLTIPYPVDTQMFQHVDKKTAREILGLPLDKKFLLVHSQKSFFDTSKSLHSLWEALKELESQKMELLYLGEKPVLPENFSFPIRFYEGYYDSISRKLLYNAADVFIDPFFWESCSYSILESLACATPVVAFRTKNNSEILQHAQNSYLAKPFDGKDLATGIDWICHHLNYRQLSIKAREKALESFDRKKILQEYTHLYEKIFHT